MTAPTLTSERDGWTDILVQRLTADKDREEFAELFTGSAQSRRVMNLPKSLSCWDFSR